MNDDDKRLLTEWLGECWHTTTSTQLYHDGATIHHCACGQSYIVLQNDFNPHRDFIRLDFSDWRVVGRLIEKIENIDIRWLRINGLWCARLSNPSKIIDRSFTAVTPQEAICRAVLAYL